MAEFVGERLRLGGVQADVTEVGAIKSLKSYYALVIGSAVYMLHWLNQAKNFVSESRSALSGKPVRIFSGGSVGTRTTDPKGQDLRAVSGPKEIDQLRDWVAPRDHRVFFGALDGTRLTGAVGLAYRIMRRSQTARESMPEGDFRDRNETGAIHSLFYIANLELECVPTHAGKRMAERVYVEFA